MVSWLRPRRSAITFDLGAAGIRACQFLQRGREPRLCDVLQLDLMPAEAADPPAAPTFEPALLRRLVGQGRFVGNDVTLVLSPPEVQFYPLRLPEQALTQAPERLEQALKWEVAQESRTEAEDLEVRHWPLPRGRGQPANVMAVVMPSQTARQWCEQLQRQHLTVRRIDVSPCALVRLSRCLWTPAENDLWGVLDLGLRHSTLTVVIGTVPTYVRSLSVCAHQWTRQLAAAFEVAYPLAEHIKREHGVQPTEVRDGNLAPADDRRSTPAGTTTVAAGPRTGRPTGWKPVPHTTVAAGPRTGRPTGWKPVPHTGKMPVPHTNVAAGPTNDLGSALSSVLRDTLHTLAQEVGRCFSYVLQSFPEHNAKRLLLAGGGAELGGLSKVLEAELDIPVAPLDAEWERGNVGTWERGNVGTRERGNAGTRERGNVPGATPRAAAAFGGALVDLETS